MHSMVQGSAGAGTLEGSRKQAVYAVGVPVELRDTVRSCFPKFDWITEDVAEARHREREAAATPSFIPAPPQPHVWLSKLGPDDAVAFWGTAAVGASTRAARFVLERGPYCDPEAPASLAYGCVNLVLRAVDPDKVAALGDEAHGPAPAFRVAASGRSPGEAGASADLHDLVVIGSKRTALLAIDRFPERRVTLFTTGKQRLAARLEWSAKGARLIHRAEQIGALVAQGAEVFTDIVEIAVAAEALGLPTQFVGADGLLDKARGDLADGSAAIYGFADAASGETLTAAAVTRRWAQAIGADDTDGAIDLVMAPAEMTHIVIGQPRKGVTPISRHFGSGAYSSRDQGFFKADFAENPELFAHCDVMMCARSTIENWINLGVGKATRYLEQIPLVSSLEINLGDTFAPAFAAHRVRQQGEHVRYALAEDIDGLGQADRAAFAEIGRRLRPLLARLQTTSRLARLNKIEMGRRIGPIGFERVLVLGHEDDNDAVQSNPDQVSDLDVLRAALNARRHAKVLYAPQKKTAADARQLAAARALDPRVEVVTSAYAISEYAHIVCEVRTVDSALGVFALAHGLPVIVYGRPFYAGLGVTCDRDRSDEPVAPAAADPIGLDAFLGWFFTTKVFCADPLSGEPITLEAFAEDWSPYLGELSDEIADRLLDRAAKPDIAPDELRTLLKVLDKHGKRSRIARLMAKLDLPKLVAGGHDVVFDLAREYALQGTWRDSVSLLFAIWRKHGQSSMAKVTATLVVARSLLNTSSEVSDFEYFVLSKFRSMSGSQIQEVGDAFRNARYFRAALACYASCLPSKPLLAAQAKCHIGLGDVEKAGALIDDLAKQKESAEVLEELRLEWLERQGRSKDILEIVERRARTAPADADLRLRLAHLYRDVGDLEKAIEQLPFVVRSRLGTQAVRNLASIYISQMQTPRARGLLRAQLDIAPSDAQCWRLLGETFSFENDLEAACECFYTALTLAPLDFASHAKLVDLEEELAKNGDDRAKGRWTGALDELVASVDQPTVETMIADGRARLRVYDFANLKRNCLKSIAVSPEDGRPHFWYAHACAWEMSEKTPEVVAEIRKSYQIVLARDRDNVTGSILDAIRSLAKIGDVEGIRTLVRENRFALQVGDKEKLDVARYSASMALGDYHGVFEAMRYLHRTRVLSRNPKRFRYATSLDEVSPSDNVLLLSEGGVGDEMRCSTLYPELVKRLPNATFSIDQRIHTLFERTFPKVKRFVALPRYHRTRFNRDMLETIGDLPDQGLAPFFDNDLWKLTEDIDVVLPIQCTLADLRRKDEDFAAGQKVRYVPRDDLVEEWRARLRPYADKLIVGATWTSMYREYQRIESYLTHEEMEPLFKTPGAVFINCQYENVDSELKWARDELGVEIIDFPDLDKRDDFERLAALIACLDLFVGTGTTTTEFAALVGCPTIYASPSNMNAYRNPAFTETDLFYKENRIIRPIPASNRSAMVERMAALLGEAVEAKRQRATIIPIPAAANAVRKAQA